jgi:alkylation response protein AidB-like acyl-CoA dehydrogenase
VNRAAELDAWLDVSWSPELTVRAWWQRLADAGYAHPTWPAAVGGCDASAAEARRITAVLVERGVLGPPAGPIATHLAAPTLLAHGNSAQIADLVRRIAYGESAWCQLFSEPGSGSDLASLSARAELDGDEWVISGQKVWSSGAHLADLGMLLARTDPAAPKHAGITWFAIDMHQPGVAVRPLRVMNGTTPFCEVFLDEARVPSSRVVGGVNSGWPVARTTMVHERRWVAGGGVQGLVSAQEGGAGDLDRTVAEVLERAAATRRPQRRIRSGAVGSKVMIELARAHGASTEPVVRQELARYLSQVRVNGWTMRRIAASRGGLTAADGSIAKLTTARICQASRELSYRIAGAELMLSGADSPMGGDLQATNLASPGTRLGGGTDEIQLNVLGERGLGLPREP